MLRAASFFAALTLFLPLSASAQQSFEVISARALGMGGAFVAVADDATAVFWNPAGLVSGNPTGGTIEWSRFQFGNRQSTPEPGPSQGSSTMTSLGSWPVGLSFARFRSTVLVADEAGLLVARTARTNHVGITVLQTVAEGLVAGTTLKYVRGRTDSAPAEGVTVAEALDRGAELEGRANGAFDLDIGLMADMQQLRVGVTVRNLRQPHFGEVAENEIVLKRRARLGVALLPTAGVTFAMDLDLDTADLEGGPSRIIAFGGEGRLGRRLAVRSGVRWSLEGTRRLLGAVGASLAVRPGLWVDGHFSKGGLDGSRAFGVALRAGY